MTEKLPEKLAAARIKLIYHHPYLATAVFALHPVSRQGLGTLAVDAWWRLYYDEAAIQRWSVDEIAGVLYHEVLHLLRDHAGRARQMGAHPRLWNHAADAEINDDILAEKTLPLPDNPITPASLGQENGKLAEEYYAALAQQAQQQAGQGQQDDSEAAASSSSAANSSASQSQSGEQDGAGQSGGEADQQPAADAAGAQGESPQDSSAQTAAGQNEESAAAGTAGAGQPAAEEQDAGRGGDDGSQAGDAGESTSSASSAQPSSPSQPATNSVQQGGVGGSNGSPASRDAAASEPSTPDAASAPAHSSSSATPSQGDGGKPDVARGRCGSCATGVKEDWELDPDDKSVPAVKKAEADLIRRKVAQEIREHSKRRGTVPAHLKRWADEVFRPKVNWRRELASAIRYALADASGMADYSYRRPSRRQSANPKVIMPALRQPLPRVAVVVDTSGSISDRMLAQAVAEVLGVIKAMGGRNGVKVLSCDAKVHTVKEVLNRRHLKHALQGGGGTDMRVGIEAALKQKPRPHVIIVLTDGYTPWQSEPPRGVKVIVALLGDGNAPSWAKTIKVEETP